MTSNDEDITREVMSKLYSLEKELLVLTSQQKSLSKKIKELKDMKKKYMETVSEYCEKTGAESVQYEDLIVRPVLTYKRKPLGKKEKEKRLLEALGKLGVEEYQIKEAYKSITDAIKGVPKDIVHYDIKLGDS